MNTCREIRDKLMHTLDAGKTFPPREARDHMDGCPACRHWWEQLCSLEKACSEAAEETPEAPDTLAERVMAALEEPAAGNAGMRHLDAGYRTRFAWWASAAAAAVILAAGISFVVLSSRSTPEKPVIVHSPEAHPNSSYSIAALPAIPSLDSLAVVPQPVIEARQDFTWLTNAVMSNTQSAVRAIASNRAETPAPRPTKTASAPIES